MDDTGEKVRPQEPLKEPVKPVRLMRDVRRIDRPRNLDLTQEPLDQIVEEPLIPIVQSLLDRGINASIEASANPERGSSAWIILDPNKLSEENFVLLNDIEYDPQIAGSTGRIDDVMVEWHADSHHGHLFWVLTTDFKPDEPIEAVAGRIAKVTDLLKPQPEGTPLLT